MDLFSSRVKSFTKLCPPPMTILVVWRRLLTGSVRCVVVHSSYACKWYDSLYVGVGGISMAALPSWSFVAQVLHEEAAALGDASGSSHSRDVYMGSCHLILNETFVPRETHEWTLAGYRSKDVHHLIKHGHFRTYCLLSQPVGSNLLLCNLNWVY